MSVWQSTTLRPQQPQQHLSLNSASRQARPTSCSDKSNQLMSGVRHVLKIIVCYILVPVITLVLLSDMLHVLLAPALAIVGQMQFQPALAAETAGSTAWKPPRKTEINSLNSALNGKGVYGFVFNTSQTPASLPYSTYNWCNMPHARRQEYVVPPKEYELKYVEVIHRHHKRTPYSSNTFPVETQSWKCDNTALYTYAAPYPPAGRNKSALAFWSHYQSEINPFTPAGFPPYSCAFPQITKQGLDDSFQHGRDLYGVYHDLLHHIPDDALSSGAVSFRVSNNPITSQVAGMLISGMFGDTTHSIPLLIQADDIDSLEPQYSCPTADALFSSYGVGSSNPKWTAHLERSAPLFKKLDSISGISPDNTDWHQSYDHYFDNLSARLCHAHPLPCNGTRCVSQDDADEVFRMGQYEYSFIYRDGGPDTLRASRASFGVWIAELVSHLEDVRDGTNGKVVYRHNVAHDGSVSRLLSVLQIAQMVWPGMGSEIVFEMYHGPKKSGPQWFVRVLFSGQVLKSSRFGAMDMIPLPRFLDYLNQMVGKHGAKVPGLCGR